MFLGTLPPPVQAIIREHALEWTSKTVRIGCSGNMTIERTLAPLGRFALHSNDVQVYSCTLGEYAATGDVSIALSEKAAEVFPWLERSMDTGPRKAATVLLLSNFALALTKPDHMYFQRLARGYEHQWDRLVEETAAKMEAFRAATPVESFTPMDVVDWLEEHAAPDDAVALSIPFIEGGYTTMFKALDEAFEWDRPGFTELDDERTERLIELVTSRRDWSFVWCYKPEHLEPYLRGSIRSTARSAPHYVFGSGEAHRIQVPEQKTEPVPIPRLKAGDRLPAPADAQLGLVRLTAPQFNSVRAFYLNRNIPPAAAADAFAVVVNGVMVGAVALSGSSSHGGGQQGNPGLGQVPYPCIFLLTDFAVAPTDYPRLSKLVVLAMTTKEAQGLMQMSANGRIRSLITTAFTNRNASMKYRGVLQLLGRKEREEGADTRYALNYGCILGERTLAQAYDEWWRKFGAVREDEDG